MTLAGSRLLYSFGRDGLLPKWLGELNKNNLPNHALGLLSGVAIVLGAIFPFAFLSQLISAGTLIAFMFVTIGIYRLRPREGKDLPVPALRCRLSGLASISIFRCFVCLLRFGSYGKTCYRDLFVLGLLIYIIYGMNNVEEQK